MFDLDSMIALYNVDGMSVTQTANRYFIKLRWDKSSLAGSGTTLKEAFTSVISSLREQAETHVEPYKSIWDLIARKLEARKVDRYDLSISANESGIVLMAEVVNAKNNSNVDVLNGFQKIANDFIAAQSAPKRVMVWLQDTGPNKVETIKIVREYARATEDREGITIVGFGLKEAKDFVEAPKPISFPVVMPLEIAKAFVNALQTAGCKAYYGDSKLQSMA